MKPFNFEYNWAIAEPKWRETWESSGVCAWNASAAQGNSKNEGGQAADYVRNSDRSNTFIIDTPPPYASGQLHMGHIFGFVQADAIARYKRMRGMNVFFTLGFDDNGLPTERAVEKEVGRKASSMPRHEFRELCMQVIDKIEGSFIHSFKQIGLSIDWSQTYRTIDDRSIAISQMSFIDLLEKNLIYRTLQPTIWDPIDQTALAQADLEDKESPGIMYDLRFKSANSEELACETFASKNEKNTSSEELACETFASKNEKNTSSEELTYETFASKNKKNTSSEELIIASTRPELLPACVSVFYHPDDARYQHLQGQTAIVPLTGAKVPILADSQVQPDKGTGLVMCCTFGDMVDIEWWRKHSLTTRVILDRAGRISLRDKLSDATFAFENTKLLEDLVNRIEGKKISEARLATVDMLKEQSLLAGELQVTRSVKCAERSKCTIEILVTPQWSIKVLEHKQLLLEKANQIAWHPDYMRHRIISWIEGLNWDWCISRQRYFGVPFPVWYSKRPGEEGKILLPTKDQLPVDPTKDLPIGYTRDEVEADTDVMDTWATSALTPQINAKGINNELAMDPGRFSQLFPADLRFQGHEIIRTWAFYTIAKAAMHFDTIPWKNIMINGWVLAADKTKMSKSKGNVVTPQALLDEHGADVVRYWASSYSPGTDIALTEEAFSNGQRLLKKLWFASKFVHGHMVEAGLKADRPQPVMASPKGVAIQSICRQMDRWILCKLTKVVEGATKAMEAFDYLMARSIAENFFWKDFCDNYLELIKTRTYDNDGNDPTGKTSAINTCALVLETVLKLLAPFMPHITEELHVVLFGADQSIHRQGVWPKLEACAQFDEGEAAGDAVVAILAVIRKFKTEEKISLKSELAVVDIETSNPNLTAESLGDAATDLQNAGQIKILSFNQNLDKPSYRPYQLDDYQAIIRITK